MATTKKVAECCWALHMIYNCVQLLNVHGFEIVCMCVSVFQLFELVKHAGSVLNKSR